MDKKGQITAFIIIGILLVLASIILYLTLRGVGEDEILKIAELPLEAQSVKLYVESCLKTTAISGTQLIGTQGGYVNIPVNHLETDYSTIAYGYYEGENTLATIEVIEYQISSYIERSLLACLGDFSSFEAQGYEIQTGDISVQTTIRTNDVLLQLDYPIDMIQQEYVINIKDFTETIDIRLGYIHGIASQIVDKTIEDPEWIDMTFLSEFDAKIDILPHDEENFVYSISDEKSMIGEEPYIFLFANKFIVNQPPVLNIPNNLTFEDGKAVIYQVNATDPEGDMLTFSDDTAMFDITTNGFIMFAPEVPGEFDITITVTDNHRNKVSKIVKFIIE